MPYTYVTSLLPSAVGGIPVRTTPATVLIVRIHLLWAAGDTTLCVSATSVYASIPTVPVQPGQPGWHDQQKDDTRYNNKQ
jgi:hypothetical protein